MRIRYFTVLLVLFLMSAAFVFPELETGTAAPEISAEEWINTESPVRLEELRGKTVVLEFWATWCGPCVQAIPHIVDLYRMYGPEGVVFISLTRENRKAAGIDKFIRKMKMEYIIGTGSSSSSDYGVSGIPHAFIINPEGRIIWHGHPMAGMDYALSEVSGLNSFTKTSVEEYRQNNTVVIKKGSVLNDTDKEITVRLYHPDAPRNGFHTLYTLKPGEEIQFWEGKYGIGNDWGIDAGPESRPDSIRFLGDIAVFDQNMYRVSVSALIGR